MVGECGEVISSALGVEYVESMVYEIVTNKQTATFELSDLPLTAKTRRFCVNR